MLALAPKELMHRKTASFTRFFNGPNCSLTGGPGHRRGAGDDRDVYLRTGAQAHSRPRVRVRTSGRFHGGAGGRVPVLRAGAEQTLRFRWLALGRPDRRAWRVVRVVHPAGVARKSALAGAEG